MSKRALPGDESAGSSEENFEHASASTKRQRLGTPIATPLATPISTPPGSPNWRSGCSVPGDGILRLLVVADVESGDASGALRGKVARLRRAQRQDPGSSGTSPVSGGRASPRGGPPREPRRAPAAGWAEAGGEDEAWRAHDEFAAYERAAKEEALSFSAAAALLRSPACAELETLQVTALFAGDAPPECELEALWRAAAASPLRRLTLRLPAAVRATGPALAALSHLPELLELSVKTLSGHASALALPDGEPPAGAVHARLECLGVELAACAARPADLRRRWPALRRLRALRFDGPEAAAAVRAYAAAGLACRELLLAGADVGPDELRDAAAVFRPRDFGPYPLPPVLQLRAGSLRVPLGPAHFDGCEVLRLQRAAVPPALLPALVTAAGGGLREVEVVLAGAAAPDAPDPDPVAGLLGLAEGLPPEAAAFVRLEPATAWAAPAADLARRLAARPDLARRLWLALPRPPPALKPALDAYLAARRQSAAPRPK